MAERDGDGSLEVFGRGHWPKWMGWRWPKRSEHESDSLRLYRDRIAVVRHGQNVPAATKHIFEKAREAMKQIANRTQMAVAEDVASNGGLRMFPRKRGIVMVSGEGMIPERPVGIHFALIYSQLHWLYRVLNTTLPTEVWLMTAADYPDKLDVDFPLVTFRVLVTTSIRDWYDIRLPGHFFVGTLAYCSKILAVLASAFEEPILLDNDNFPLIDPRELYDHPMYLESGHVMWCDAQPRFINKDTIRLLGLTQRPGEENVHSDGGQIAMDRRKYLPGLAAVFHIALELGENLDFFFGDKDLWRIAFMFQHQAPSTTPYHVPGEFRPVLNFPSWVGNFDFKTVGNFQRKFRIWGYAQMLGPHSTAPAFMHFSGGAKLFLLEMVRSKKRRRNLVSHFYKVAKPEHEIYKDILPVNDLGWCTESTFYEANILPMPMWIQRGMNWILDRINESMAVYPIPPLDAYVRHHTVTGDFDSCFH